MMALSLFACEKVVDVDVPFEDPSLVVNGFLNPDSSFEVHLSKSKFILDHAELRNITDARVSIYEGEQKLGDLQHQENGYYLLEHIKPAFGKQYTLKAEREGFAPISVSEQVLRSIPPLDVKAEKLPNEDEYQYQTRYRFTFELEDPAAEKNYYLLRAYEKRTGQYYNQKGELIDEYTYWNNLSLESPDPSLEEICMGSCDFLLADTFFDGKTYKVSLNGSSYYWGGEEKQEVYMALYHISETAYLYYKTLDRSYSAEGDPFAEPVRVYSNVEGGYGIWASIAGKIIKADL